eukprot:COSAG02_NODE_60674_length_270_cov_1.210526_1_plen_27_part_10
MSSARTEHRRKIASQSVQSHIMVIYYY